MRLERGFYDRLAEFASGNRSSVFHLILGAFYCYLTRAHGRGDLPVGLLTLNRNNAISRQTAGLFTGANPAWLRLGTDLDFIGLMAAIRRELRLDYRHQRLPMSEIHRQAALGHGERLFDLTLSYARHDYDVHLHGAPANVHPTLFQRIATDFRDAERILERIESQGKRPTKRPQDTADDTAPRTPEEAVLAGIWAEVLGPDRVGVHDNFFRLGGHSLLGVQVMSRIRETFAAELPLHVLFEEPTIAQLASRLRTASRYADLPPITPVDRTGPLPLSFAQQRLWFLDRLEKKSSVYNIVAAVRLAGHLDTQALESSLQTLAVRHENLRTVFPTVNGAPLARITNEPWRLAFADLGPLAAPEQASEVQRLLEEEARHVFNLATGPLFRAQLIRLDGTLHVLQLNLHHIIADGWSMGIFAREWRIAYEAALGGQPAPLPPLPVQYADFAHWQRDWLTGEVLERQLAYWKEQLAGAPVSLELPTDHPRPPVRGYGGASLSFAIPNELTAGLDDLR